MQVPVDFRNESELRNAFAYLTRTGMGPSFGSRPNGWYQVHQCHALDVLVEHARRLHGGRINALPSDTFKVRVRKGNVQFGFGKEWKDAQFSPAWVFLLADARSRQ